MRPSKFTCSWTPTELFKAPHDCETSLLAPDNLGLYPDGVLPTLVTIFADGMTIPSAPFKVNIKDPPARFYDFVLDATENMAAVFDGKTLFDREKEDINSHITRFGAGGGWLAITAFGQDVSDKSDDCARYGVIYPVAPLKPDVAQEAVNKLGINGHIAPIAAAIDTAVKQFSALRATYPEAKMKSYFILITASANGCQGIKFADAIAEIGTAFASNNINYEHYGRDILSAVVTLRTSPDEKVLNEYLNSSSYNSMDNHTIVFTVDQGGQASQAIKSAHGLVRFRPVRSTERLPLP